MNNDLRDNPKLQSSKIVNRYSIFKKIENAEKPLWSKPNPPSNKMDYFLLRWPVNFPL